MEQKLSVNDQRNFIYDKINEIEDTHNIIDFILLNKISLEFKYECIVL